MFVIVGKVSEGLSTSTYNEWVLSCKAQSRSRCQRVGRSCRRKRLEWSWLKMSIERPLRKSTLSMSKTLKVTVVK